MRHVSPEKRTVYRHAKGGRFYASKRHAYYDLAKQMIKEKYPPMLVGHQGSFDVEPEQLIGDAPLQAPAEIFGMSPELCERRRAKARALWWDAFGGDYIDGGYREPEGEAHSTKKWCAFVSRVARFLQWRDDRGARPL